MAGAGGAALANSFRNRNQNGAGRLNQNGTVSSSEESSEETTARTKDAKKLNKGVPKGGAVAGAGKFAVKEGNAGQATKKGANKARTTGARNGAQANGHSTKPHQAQKAGNKATKPTGKGNANNNQNNVN